MLEIPVVKDKSSLFLSARRTYVGMLFRAFSERLRKQDMELYFYDINAKYTHSINNNNKLYFSLYWGKDVLSINTQGNKMGFEWGNIASTFSWNHIFNSKFFSSTTLTFNQYEYDFALGNGFVRSFVRDWAIKENLQYFQNDRSKINMGVELIYHTYDPGKIKTKTSNYKLERYGLENNLYVTHKWKLTNKLTFDYGLRYSIYSVLGPTTIYEFNDFGDITKETKKSGFVKTYQNFEPRIFGNYAIDSEQSVKLGVGWNTQYLNVLSTNNSGTPLDTYIPVTTLITPQKSAQASAGYFRNFLEETYESSLEIYYKDMRDLTDYKEGADIFNRKGIESEVVKAKGWSYGLEFLLKKKKGDFTGWIGYTWSITKRQSDKINRGKAYFAPEDRTHDVYVVLMYKIDEKWQVTTTWSYSSGTPTTYPEGKYFVENIAVPAYSVRNEHRLPDYHRLDAGLVYKTKLWGLDSSFALSAYNVYARKNPYRIQFKPDDDNILKGKSTYTSLFGTILPSFSWTLKF